MRAAEDRLRSRATGADVHPTVWVMRSAWIERGATVGGPGQRAGAGEQRPVTVGDGCWIGSGAMVTRSTEPNGLHAGVPARRV
ncbi:hypothetical protein ACIPJU_08945 [Micrococcus endophyticus]|uniref:hypothetical protein n=1 Tax=Micrococcus endophyticus TaxID=455343 RepID=UPI00380CAB26